MFRTSDVLLIAVMLSAAAFTYKTKHDAESMMDRVSKLNSRIAAEKDTIDVLKADWSLLTQPGRLQKLAEIHSDELGLKLVEPRQIVDPSALSDIPFKEVNMFIAEGGGTGTLTDQTMTGSINP